MIIIIYADNATTTKLLSGAFEAMNIPEEYAKGTIRISLGHNNTESDAKNIAETLIRILMQ